MLNKVDPASSLYFSLKNNLRFFRISLCTAVQTSHCPKGDACCVFFAPPLPTEAITCLKQQKQRQSFSANAMKGCYLVPLSLHTAQHRCAQPDAMHYSPFSISSHFFPSSPSFHREASTLNQNYS